jgi:hypothetical protein
LPDEERVVAEGAEGVPKGFYFDGEVYLVASQLATPEEAARVLYHEALGHHGLRGAFGEKLDAVLDQIIVARPREVRAKLQEYGELDDLVGRRYAAEEVLAEMAETQPQLGFVRRAVAAIRAWLRDHVPALRDLAMSNDEQRELHAVSAMANMAEMVEGRTVVPVIFLRSRPDQVPKGCICLTPEDVLRTLR